MYFSKILCLVNVYICGILVREATTCDTFTATNSWQFIESHPNYNGWRPYANYYEECWEITAINSNQIIQLVAVEFEVESGDWHHCDYDVLKIYDNDEDEGTHKDFCGFDVFEIYSSQRYLYLEFSTDYSVTYAGFKLKFKQVDASNYDPGYWTTSTPSPTSTFSEVWPSPTATDNEITFAEIVGVIFGVLLAILLMVIVCVIGCVICVTNANRPGRLVNPNQQVDNAISVQQQHSLNPLYNSVHLQPGYYYNQPPPAYNPAVRPPHLPPVENSGAMGAVPTNEHVDHKAPIPD